MAEWAEQPNSTPITYDPTTVTQGKAHAHINTKMNAHTNAHTHTHKPRTDISTPISLSEMAHPPWPWEGSRPVSPAWGDGLSDPLPHPHPYRGGRSTSPRERRGVFFASVLSDQVIGEPVHEERLHCSDGHGQVHPQLVPGAPDQNTLGRSLRQNLQPQSPDHEHHN